MGVEQAGNPPIGKKLSLRDQVRMFIVNQHMSLQEARQALGLPINSNKFNLTVSRLRKEGESVPYGIKPRDKELLREIRETDAPARLKSLMRRVGKGLYATHNSGEHADFIPVTRLAFDAGFLPYSKAIKFFVESLEKGSVVQGEIVVTFKSGSSGKTGYQRYHFIRMKDQEIAKNVLLNDNSLGIFRQQGQRKVS